MRVRNALLLDNVARGNPYARLPTHSSNIMAATVKASRYGNKAKIGKSAAKLVVYDENVHRAQWSVGLRINMVCSTPGMSEQSLKLSTNNLFVVRSRSVRAAVGDGRKMIEAHKGNNSKLALADTHFDLSLSRDSYFGRNLYSRHTPSLLSDRNLSSCQTGTTIGWGYVLCYFITFCKFC